MSGLLRLPVRIAGFLLALTRKLMKLAVAAVVAVAMLVALDALLLGESRRKRP